MQNINCIIVSSCQQSVTHSPSAGGHLFIPVHGGLDYCALLGLEPDLVLGDFDSAGKEQLARIARWEREDPRRVVRLKPEKDDTDTLAAIRLALERGYTSFALYGATGGRLEHTIANIQCLLFLKRHGAAGYMTDGMGKIFVMEDEELCFPASIKGYLSLFSLGKEALGVNIRGMKYELDNARITNDFPIGISNEFIGQEALVSVGCGQLLGIMSAGN